MSNHGSAASLSALVGSAMTSTILLLVSPIHTFLRPVLEQGSVGQRTVHAYILGMVNCATWMLYDALSAPSSTPFIAINGVGVILQLFYIIVYLRFATEQMKREHAIIFFFAAVSVSVVVASVLSLYMVFTSPAWTTTMVGFMASASGACMHMAPILDVVKAVTMSKQVRNMNPVRAILTLFNGPIFIAYALIMSVTVNFYLLVPNLIGTVSALVQITAHMVYVPAGSCIHIDALDYGDEMRELFTSPV